MALDLDVVLLVERLDLAGEIVERGLGLLVEVVISDLEFHPVFVEGLLEGDLPLGQLRQHAGVLGALQRILRFLAELRDLRVILREVRVGGFLLLLEVFDLRFDGLDLLAALRLGLGDLAVDVLVGRARAESQRYCGEAHNLGEFHQLLFLSVRFDAMRGGSVPR